MRGRRGIDRLTRPLRFALGEQPFSMRCFLPGLFWRSTFIGGYDLDGETDGLRLPHQRNLQIRRPVLLRLGAVLVTAVSVALLAYQRTSAQPQ